MIWYIMIDKSNIWYQPSTQKNKYHQIRPTLHPHHNRGSPKITLNAGIPPGGTKYHKHHQCSNTHTQEIFSTLPPLYNAGTITSTMTFHPKSPKPVHICIRWWQITPWKIQDCRHMVPSATKAQAHHQLMHAAAPCRWLCHINWLCHCYQLEYHRFHHHYYKVFHGVDLWKSFVWSSNICSLLTVVWISFCIQFPFLSLCLK